MTHVSVCLCTFRRASLVDTLVGLAAQKLKAGITFDVVVVDSDLQGSAQDVVARAQSTLPISIRYVRADVAGVAAARNLAVANAVGPWLAFLDDDEVPATNWLSALVACAECHQAQVVFGTVETRYPDGCPAWIRDVDLFGKYTAPTGTRVQHGPTCNTLLWRHALDGQPHVFDLSYGTTGGEDTELFNRLSAQGVVMVTCREAVVSETIESHRLNRHFLMRKAVRVGETYFRIFFAQAPLFARASLLARASAQCLLASLVALILLPFGLGRSMVYQIKAAANLGKLRAALGHSAVELYKG